MSILMQLIKVDLYTVVTLRWRVLIKESTYVHSILFIVLFMVVLSVMKVKCHKNKLAGLINEIIPHNKLLIYTKNFLDSML